MTLLSLSQNYLATRGWTWRTVLTESLVALQRGVFLLSGELGALGARAQLGRRGPRRGPGAAPAQTLRSSACSWSVGDS